MVILFPKKVYGLIRIGLLLSRKDIPRSKKEVQSFLGKVNLLSIFITNFAEIVKYITNMLRKDNGIKWTVGAKQSIADIKMALNEAPVLISPYFTKYFMIFSFASEHTVARVLLQKNDRNLEQPISFYSKALRDYTLKYNIMEKQAYALFTILKEFRVYISHSHTVTFVPSSSLKDILTQLNLEGKRAKWISSLLEYNLEIRPIKLIKG